MKNWVYASVALLALVGCGSGNTHKGSSGGTSSIKPPATDHAQPWDQPAAPTIRIDLSFEGGPPTLVSARALSTPPPIPALGGSYHATVWANGAIVDAVAIAPADVVRDARGNAKGEFIEETSPAAASRATLFVKDDPGLERIEILDAGGAVVLTIQPDQVQRVTTNSLNEFRAQYPWIHVVGVSEDPHALLPTDLTDQIESVVDPNDELVGILEEAFGGMTEGARRSVATIVFAHMPDFGRHDVGGACTATFGRAFGSSFLINADGEADEVVNGCFGGGFARPVIVQTVFHETAHNFTFLLDAVHLGGLEAWPPEGQEIARQATSAYRLQAGLSDLFISIQQTAVDAEVAPPYFGPGAIQSGLGPADGFATSYGATDEREDIAEITASVQMPHTNPTAICAFLSASSEVNEENALLYAKTLALKELGFISSTQFQACVGGLEISAEPGIHLGNDFSLNSDTKSGVIDQDGGHFFAVLGKGPNTYEGLLRVLAPTNQPIGLHRLDDIGIYEVLNGLPNNGFYLSNDRYELVRTSGSGLVLVAEASGTTSRGVVLFLTLQSGLGNTTDRFPLSTWSIQ